MSGSDLNSIQESLSNRVAECVTIDPETEIEPCITQDVPLGHGRAELSYPPHPDQVEPDDALVPSCCRGLARQPSSEPQDTPAFCTYVRNCVHDNVRGGITRDRFRNSSGIGTLSQ